jgi:DNA-binding CsgD family transcriptional regulator
MSSDQLLDAIYSAAFDVAGWKTVCDLLSQHAGAVGSVLVSSKAEQRPFSTIYSDRLGLLMEEYIADGWYLRDARNIGVRRAGLQGSFFSNGYVTDLQLFGSDELEREPFYADLLRRHGLKWYCGFRIGDNRDWTVLSINRSLRDEGFSTSEIKSIGQYVSHITRSAKIASLANFKAIEGVLQTFEASSIPAVAIDARGLVRAHNLAADKVFGHGLSLHAKRLVCALAEDQIPLDGLITQLATAERAKDLTDPVTIRRRDGTEAFVVRGWPLFGPPAEIFSGPTAILFLQPVKPTPKRMAEVLQASFGLSPRQAQLAEELAIGRSLKEAAEQMRITDATARDHLKAVFLRTGTNRQAQLVSLVSRLMQ